MSALPAAILPEADIIPFPDPYPEIAEQEREETAFIISTVNPEYIKDSDPYDFAYIAQRYLYLALLFLLQGKKVVLVLPQTSWTQAIYDLFKHHLQDIQNSRFISLEQNLSIVRVDPRFYFLSNAITGELPDIIEIRQNPTEPPEKFFYSIPENSEAYQIVKKTRDALFWSFVGFQISKLNQVRSYSPGGLNPSKLAEALQRETGVIISDWSIYWLADQQKIQELHGKAWMHPHRKTEEYLDPDLINKIWKDFFPAGYYVPAEDWVDGLIRAIIKLNQSRLHPLQNFIIKPVEASSGEGIAFAKILPNGEVKFCYDKDCKHEIPDPQQIFKMWDVIVEELLDLNTWNFKIFGKNMDLSLVIPYTDGQVEGITSSGNVLLQATKDGHYMWWLLVSPEVAAWWFDMNPHEFEKKINELEQKIQILIDHLGLTGSGAVDILITKDWRFVISDPNLGRDTGSMVARVMRDVFKQLHGGKPPAYIYNLKIPLDGAIDSQDLKNLNQSSFEKPNWFALITFEGDHLTVLVRGESEEKINNVLAEFFQHINNYTKDIIQQTQNALYSLFQKPSPPNSSIPDFIVKYVTSIPYSTGL